LPDRSSLEVQQFRVEFVTVDHEVTYGNFGFGQGIRSIR
jgi:hypothetical protein